MTGKNPNIKECSRCKCNVSLDDAVVMTQKSNKAMWRYLCPDCLHVIGVPQGYELKRDLSHLKV